MLSVTRHIWFQGYSSVTEIDIRKSTLQTMHLSRVHVVEWFCETNKLSNDPHRHSCSKLCRLITCPEKELSSLCAIRPYKCRVSTSIKSHPLPSRFFLCNSEVTLPIHTVSPSCWQRCKETDGTWKYTLSNKNPSAWNFLNPEPDVTCGTIAIINRVFLLSPYLAFVAFFCLPFITFNHTAYILTDDKNTFA